MSAHGKLGTYGTTHREHRTDREIDMHALLNCATRLQTALDDGGQDMKSYAEAIKHNQRLWTIFQVSLCDPESQLPQDLKLTLLSLSSYVDRVSFRAVTEFMPEMVASLIDINRIIAKGLSVTVATEANASIAQQPTTFSSATAVRTSV